MQRREGASMSGMKRVGAAAIVGVVLIAGCKTKKPFGGMLPPSAVDVREVSVDMFPDWEYYVRATMPGPDCEALLVTLAGKEGLAPLMEHRFDGGNGEWGPGQPPVWWAPVYDGGHFHGKAGDVNTCAMCRDGIFYYWQGSH
ncbi:MAG: hypothetical protein IPK82_21755 [Polyangiaceae bacterium]|nr:hypothetical protein [Polyangiaceae bacterium]